MAAWEVNTSTSGSIKRHLFNLCYILGEVNCDAKQSVIEI